MTTSEQRSDADTARAVQLFIEALNARDLEALRATVTPDVQFPSPEGGALRGAHGVEELVAANRDANILLARDGQEELASEGGQSTVTVPVKVIVGRSHLRGTARFKASGGKISSFQVITHS